jgi:uncharacterized heparinase superfamily protein
VRLVGGETILLFDAGPTDKTLPGDAPFAGALSFELSAGRSALIVNCGAEGGRISAQRPEARATANHSALVLADASSAPMAGGRSGSTSVSVTVPKAVETGGNITAAGTAYRDRFGYTHKRTLTLAPDGLLLEGADTLVTSLASPSSHPFAVHFHLHPSVYVETDEQALRLTAADGSRWRFTAAGAVPSVETSTYFAATTGAKPTIQIVLRGRLPATSTVTWRLERSSGPTLQAKS